MRKFKGKKSTDAINEEMSRLGMEIDDSEFKKGGDWIMYRGEFTKSPFPLQ